MSSPVTEKVIVPDKVDDNNDDQDKVKEEEEKKGAEKDDEEDEVHVDASEASSVDDGDSKVSDGQSSGSTSEYESLDNDEDRRNPQYIPKRGAFYEHDDRIMSDEEEDKGDNDNNNSGNSNNINANNNNNDVEEEKSESQQPQPQQQPKAGTPVVEKGKKPKKKSTNDGAWGHDLFNDAEQKPKSRIEIINSYGYDIREEEGPPKARRRRKYGRGHTRNERPPRENVQGVKPPRRPPNPSSKQDFPDIAKAESKPEPRPVNKEVKNPKRAERVERVERTDRIERAERAERPERIERIERAERIERVERVERTEEPPVMVKTQVFKNSRRDPRDSRDSRREPIHPKDQAPRGDNFIRGKNRPKFEDRDFPSPRDGPRVEREAPSRESRGRLPRDIPRDIPQIHRDTGRPNRSSHQNDTIPPEDGPGDRGDRKNRYPNRWDRERDFKDRRNDHEIDRDRRRGDSYRTRGYHDDRGYEVEDARLTTGMGQISLNRHRSSDMRNDKVKPAHQEMNRYVNPVPRGSRENNNYNNNHSRDVQHIQSTNSHIADPRAPPTKRYSSLRQQQRQEQRVQQPPPKLPPTKQTTENVINNEQSQPSPPPPQPPLQQLNVNHQQRRPTSNSHFYDAQTGSAPSNYYPETRSPQSTYNYVPPNDMDQGRFPQMAPRPFIPSTAPPPSVPESRFLTQSVTSAPSPAALATIPHVLPGPPPGAAYLPTYPPGYPQFPPPPPPPAAQYSINVQGVPPTPPVNPDLYVASDMGTVYYDTVTQQVSPRQLPQRRPKNALPIVPPPSTTEADSDVYQGVETVT